MDKKGDMTIGMIIAIALGVLLLVLLVFGVSTGFGNLWGKITQYGGMDNNIADVTMGCEVACAQNNVYDYCTVTRKLSFGKEACIHDTTFEPIENCLECEYIIEVLDDDGKEITDVPNCVNIVSATCDDAEKKRVIGVSCNICPAE